MITSVFTELAMKHTWWACPYWHYGDPSCVLFYRMGRQIRYPGVELRRENTLPILCIPPLIAHQLASARLDLLQGVPRVMDGQEGQ